MPAQDIPREYLIKRLGGVQTGADVTGTPGWKDYITATYERATPAGAPRMVRASLIYVIRGAAFCTGVRVHACCVNTPPHHTPVRLLGLTP